MTRRIVRVVAWIVWGVIVDLLELAALMLAVGLLTALLGLMLPIDVAFVVALLGVCTVFGYRRARLIERNRRDAYPLR